MRTRWLPDSRHGSGACRTSIRPFFGPALQELHAISTPRPAHIARLAGGARPFPPSMRLSTPIISAGGVLW
jgi:hypothetical protein